MSPILFSTHLVQCHPPTVSNGTPVKSIPVGTVFTRDTSRCSLDTTPRGYRPVERRVTVAQLQDSMTRQYTMSGLAFTHRTPAAAVALTTLPTLPSCVRRLPTLKLTSPFNENGLITACKGSIWPSNSRASGRHWGNLSKVKVLPFSTGKTHKVECSMLKP